MAHQVRFDLGISEAEISSEEAAVLARWLAAQGARPALALNEKLTTAIEAPELVPIGLSAMEITATRQALESNDLRELPGLETLLRTLSSPVSPGPTRKASEIYVVQIASFGGPKLGFEHDPEGAWTDNSVYFDRDEAEREARLLETAQLVNEADEPIEGVVTTTRVITIEDVDAEFGPARVDLIMTAFRRRLSELWKELRDAGEEHSS
jgi:hypothetical protein